jgi:PhnB protein
MLSFTPYLHFKGKAEEAMNFYKSILGGEFVILARYRDVPGGEKMDKEDQERIIHISLQVNSTYTIMATDIANAMEQPLIPGTNFHICIHTKSEAEVDRILNSLSAGGRVDMPASKTFFGAYFAICADKYGVQWMIEYTYPQSKQ